MNKAQTLQEILLDAYFQAITNVCTVKEQIEEAKNVRTLLDEFNPDWRDSLSGTQRELLDVGEDRFNEYMSIAEKGVAELWGARNSKTGVVLTFDGLMQDKEAVEAAIEISGVPDLVPVYRLVSDWRKPE